MLEWKLVKLLKVGIDRYNMNAYTQVATLTAIFRICYFLFITETPLRKYKLSGIYKWRLVCISGSWTHNSYRIMYSCYTYPFDRYNISEKKIPCWAEIIFQGLISWYGYFKRYATGELRFIGARKALHWRSLSQKHSCISRNKRSSSPISWLWILFGLQMQKTRKTFKDPYKRAAIWFLLSI